MTQRRKQTQLDGGEPSVRLYKYIALTFLCITIILFVVILFMSTKRAVITIEAKAEPVDSQATVTLGERPGDDGLTGIVTTTRLILTEEFQPTGTREEDGVATGTVTLYNVSRVSQPLVKTTRLLTPENVLFRLKQGVTVPAGGSIAAEVYADQSGKDGNIVSSTFTIPGLPEARRLEVYARSTVPMKGGVRKVGVVSSEDIANARTALLKTMEAEGGSTLSGAYPHLKGATTVVNEVIESSVPVGDEVSSFALTGTATVVGAFYTESDMAEWARAKLAKRALSDIEVISPSDTPPTVTIEKYYSDRNEADLAVFIDGNATLNVNSGALQKTMFFGKSKDEIRRYVLSLDHVRGVDIAFSPAWMRTVPFMEDHVVVIVKNVE